MTNQQVKRKAEEYVKFWAELLRVHNWEISVVVPEQDIGVCAQVKHCMEHSRAVIEVRNPAMQPPDSFADPDIEITVVHELLHLRMPINTSRLETFEDKLFESGIERIATALVRLRRLVQKQQTIRDRRKKV